MLNPRAAGPDGSLIGVPGIDILISNLYSSSFVLSVELPPLLSDFCSLVLLKCFSFYWYLGGAEWF